MAKEKMMFVILFDKTAEMYNSKSHGFCTLGRSELIQVKVFWTSNSNGSPEGN